MDTSRRVIGSKSKLGDIELHLHFFYKQNASYYITLCNIMYYTITYSKCTKDTKSANFNSWEAIPSRKGGYQFPQKERYSLGTLTWGGGGGGVPFSWGSRLPVTLGID